MVQEQPLHHPKRRPEDDIREIEPATVARTHPKQDRQNEETIGNTGEDKDGIKPNTRGSSRQRSNSQPHQKLTNK